MQAIEFEVIPHEHLIPVPAQIPDGIKLRVLILMEDARTANRQVGKSTNRSSPKLSGTVKMADDLIRPAVPDTDSHLGALARSPSQPFTRQHPGANRTG